MASGRRSKRFSRFPVIHLIMATSLPKDILYPVDTDAAAPGTVDYGPWITETRDIESKSPDCLCCFCVFIESNAFLCCLIFFYC